MDAKVNVPLVPVDGPERTHQGKKCCGRTPLVTLVDGKSIWAEKNLAQI